MSYLQIINFCEAERKRNSKLTAIEDRLRFEDKKLDWMKDKKRRHSLRYGPPLYRSLLQHLPLPKEPFTDVRYAILTELTSGMQYRTSHSVGKALCELWYFKGYQCTKFNVADTNFLRSGRSHTNKIAQL